MKEALERVADRPTGRLVTVGRKTGKPQEVEVYFAYREARVYFLAHADAQWHLNLAANPNGWLAVGSVEVPLRATWIDQDPYRVQEVMDLFRAKYGEAEVRRWYEGTDRYAVQAEVLDEATRPAR